MRFITASGTEYILKDVKMVIEATGEPIPSVGPQGIPVSVSYTGSMARVGVPMYDMRTGEKELGTTDEFHPVEFFSMPIVGERFIYDHSVWLGCYSTAVIEIFEDE